MKRFLVALGLALIFTVTAVSACFAADNYDTFTDWEIMVAVPDGAEGVMSGGDYYIYPDGEEGIPYVMLHVYGGYEDEEDFVYDFTDFMADTYSDLEILDDKGKVTIDGVNFYEIDYGYQVSGYDILDRRLIKIVNGLTYMFASKEVNELGLTLDGMLEEVIADSIFLQDGEPVDVREISGSDYQEEYEEIWWEDYEDLHDDVDGDFVAFEEAGYELFIPDFLHEIEAPVENAGYIGYFVDDDYSRACSVQYVYIDMTKEQYTDYLKGVDGVEIIQDILINGSLVTIYKITDADTGCFSLVTDDGYALEVACAPLSDEDYAGVAELMGISIRPIQESPTSIFSSGR